MAKTAKQAADYILPLNINGLSGRMLRVPGPKNKKSEILLVYGHHALLERWWGLAQNLSHYGTVTMPDLPGCGGMQSFSKIGIRPDIDAFADYLAAFIKLRYKRKKITIYGVSFGFVVVTRMLQRYPDIAKQVDLLISAVGFMHKTDITYGKRVKWIYKAIIRTMATRPIALAIRHLFLNKFMLKHLYSRFPNSRRRMLEITPDEFDNTMNFEVKLWQANDVRTHWLTTSEFLSLDNCKIAIALPVVHIVSAQDHYLNNLSVEQHMRQIFAGYRQFKAKTKAHVPNVLANKKAMAVMVPPQLRQLLNKKPR